MICERSTPLDTCPATTYTMEPGARCAWRLFLHWVQRKSSKPITGMATTALSINERPMKSAVKSLARIIAISAASLGVFALAAEAKGKYPTCKAASENVDYGTGLSIPEDTRALIESYRAEWR